MRKQFCHTDFDADCSSRVGKGYEGGTTGPSRIFGGQTTTNVSVKRSMGRVSRM